MTITAADIFQANILIVDDQEPNVLLLEQLLLETGYTSVTTTMDPQAVCAQHHETDFDLILLDLQMPVMDGFEVMAALKADDTNDYLPVLVLTAQPNHKLQALQSGAKDFISKPFDLVEVKTRIYNMLEVRLLYKQLEHTNNTLEETVQKRTAELTRSNLQLTQEIEERKKAEASLRESYTQIKQLKDKLQAENVYLQKEVSRQYNFDEIIGNSELLSQVFQKVEQVAPITVDCTTSPATLIESELFGRERGAFTGSDSKQIGRFELADGGTLFLDEIGELPLDMQAKLLRVIQDGEFERLGSPRTIKVDVRIIAATNRNIINEVRNGMFREDLFYRLNVFPITLPPLRQRKEDIPLLVKHFVIKFNKKIGKQIDIISTDALNTLQAHHWPGNVRELESAIERAVILSEGNSLQVLDRFETFDKLPASEETSVKALVDLEHDHIVNVLKQTSWRIEGPKGAALILGLNASTLRARMRKYGIVRE